MATIGSAVLEIIPSARGIGGAIGQQIGGDLTSVGRSAGVRLGEAVADGVKSAKSAVDRAVAQLAAAQTKQADSIGKVEVAELKLQELRESGKAKASQLVAAENNLSTARNRANEATAATARADQNLASAKDRLKQATDDAAKSHGRHATAVLQSQDAMRGLGSAASGAVTHVAKLGTAAVAAAAAFAGFKGVKALVGDAISGGAQRLSTIESATASLTVTMDDAGKATEFVGEMLKTVNGTPFNLDQFAKAGSTLVSLGADAAEVPKYLTAIGNVAASKGAEAGEYVDRLAEAFGTIATTGQLGTNELKSIELAGAPAFRILANESGKSVEAMKKLVSQGAIPAKEGLAMLVKGIMDGTDGIAGVTPKLGGQMEALRKTYDGALGGMKSARTRLGAAFLKPFRDEFVGVFNAAADAMGAFQPKLEAFSQKIVDTGIIRKFGESLADLPAKLDKWGTKVSEIWGSFKDSEIARDSLTKLRSIFDGLIDVAHTAGPALAGIGQSLSTAAGATGVSAWTVLLDVLQNIAPILNATVVPALQLTSSLMTDHQGLVTTAAIAYTAFKTVPGIMHAIVPSVASMNETLSQSEGKLTRYQASIMAVRGAASNVSGGLRGFAADVRSTREAAASAGQPIGLLGGSFRTLGDRVGGVKGAMSGLGSIASGAMGALGGPFGIALLAAGAGLTVFTQRQEAAKQAAREHESAIKDLTGMLDQHTAAVTEQMYISKAKDLADKGLIETGRNLKLSEKDLVAAHLNNADALGRVNGTLTETLRKSIQASDVYKGAGDNWERAGISVDLLADAFAGVPGRADEASAKITAYNNAAARGGTIGRLHVESLGALRNSLDDSGKSAADLGESVGKSNEDLKAAQQRVSDAAAAMEKGRSPASRLGDALQRLGGFAGSAEEKISALDAALTIFNGDTVGVEKAEANLNAAVRGVTSAFGEAGPSVVVDGRFDTKTEVGDSAYRAAESYRQSTLIMARAAYDAKKDIGDLAGAQAAATEVVAASRQKYIDAAAGLGLFGEEAERFADNYVGRPLDVVALLSLDNQTFKVSAKEAEDIAETLGKLEPSPKVDLILKELNEKKEIAVQALVDLAKETPEPEARLEILELIRKVTQAQGEIDSLQGKTVPVDADTKSANDKLDALRTRLEQPWFLSVQTLVSPVPLPPTGGASIPLPSVLPMPGGQHGGRMPLPAFQGGGRMPGYGPGTERTDGIYAVTRDGRGVAMVDGKEWIVRSEMSDKYNRELAEINAGTFPKLPGYEQGGRLALDRTAAFLSRESGKEYQYGGVGNPSWDCSSFASAAYALMRGLNPYQRWFTTESDFRALGLAPGLDQNAVLNLGVMNGGGGMYSHMAGTLNGIPFESRSDGVRYGNGALGANDPSLPNRWHLPNELASPPIILGNYTSAPRVMTESDRIELERARLAVSEAREKRDNPKEKATDNDRRSAQLAVEEAENRLAELQQKQRGTRTIAPDAPALVGGLTDEQMDEEDALISRDEAIERRNEVYANPDSTENDMRRADQAVRRAESKLDELRREQIEKGMHDKDGKRLKTFTELGSDLGGILAGGILETFGLENSSLADPNGFLGTNSGDNVRTTDKLPTGPNVSPLGQLSQAEMLAQAPFVWDPTRGPEQLLDIPGIKLFDDGGKLKHNSLGLNLSGEDEAVLTSAETREWKRGNAAVDALMSEIDELRSGGGGSGGSGGAPLIGEMHTHGPDARAVWREMETKLEARMGSSLGRYRW